jgi:hypothetical protein
MGYPEIYNEIDQWRDELRRSHSGSAVVRAIEERLARETDPTAQEILNHFLGQEHVALGNIDAANAVRRRHPADEVYRWRDEWLESGPEIDLVAALEQKIANERHPKRLHALRSLLAQEQRVRRNYLASEAVYLADFDAAPDEPHPLIFLAQQKLYDEERPEDAMSIIDRAVDVAMRSGVWRREALGVKARIALELAVYPVVEDVLRQIMQLVFTRGNPDVGAERDFFDRLPPGSVDPDVAHAYDEYCRARGRRRTASHQQIDAYILSFVAARWLKVARIIADVLKQCEHDQLATDEYIVGGCIQGLVEDGKLEAQGNLSRWRHCEVRLPETEAPEAPQGDTSLRPRAPAGRESEEIIARRNLTIDVEGREFEVPITIERPVDRQDHWRCAFEIRWPHRTRRGQGNGIDAVQALVTALQMIGAELYASGAHKSGKLKWHEPGSGYGFPLHPMLRDDAEGLDKLM